MRLGPKETSDWLVLPLLLWIPIAFLRIVGLQAAKSGEEVVPVLHNLGIVTSILLVPFALGVWQKMKG
jgi:hypothetical protein